MKFSPIIFKRNYIVCNPDGAKKTFTITHNASTREYFDVIISDGKSVEQIIRETYYGVDLYADTVNDGQPNTIDYPHRFRILRQCLSGIALQRYVSLMDKNYNTRARQTQANYKKVKKELLTELADYKYPGNLVRKYALDVVKYDKSPDDKGHFMPPRIYQNRVEEIVECGKQMEHTHGNDFVDDATFIEKYYDQFPGYMRSWMEHDQQKDPFDSTNPLDMSDISDTFQHYYDKNLRGKSIGKRNQDMSSIKDDDGDGQPKNKRRKKSNNKSGGGGSGGNHGDCWLHAHADFNHNWDECFMNPQGNNYNHQQATKFAESKAKGKDAWYKGHFAEGKRLHQEKQRNNNGDRGSYQGRGQGNGNRGGNRGNHNNYQGNNNHFRGNHNNFRGNNNNNNYQGNNNNNNNQGNGGTGYWYNDNGGYQHGNNYQPPPDNGQMAYAFDQRRVPQAPPSSHQGPPSNSRGGRMWFG